MPASLADPRGADDFPVVAIGASAGGLEACQKLFDGLAAASPMAFILVQHLDPTHESMMVDLLSAHTPLPVSQAVSGGRLERGHVYVIPPGAYLSVVAGALVVSRPRERHGARLPFDFLLAALAKDRGDRTICVILSGSGDDGSVGLKAVKAAGGVVIAQDPDEAAYDGMPRGAILTGGVDQVLPVAKIPDAIAAAARMMSRGAAAHAAADGVGEALAGIIALVRQATAQDFSLYKPGTLHRRVQRRMSLAAIPVDRVDQYLARLRVDAGELGALARDLLIHVTGFFRDPKAFDVLGATIAPEIVRDHLPGEPIRVWVPACSTGEEAYSVAIVLREAIVAAGGEIKLQVFASDIDAEAVAIAREGLYPDSIGGQVSAARLARFFSKDEHGYRVSPELRASVVFTAQNLLADPPFAKLDLISCRNLLIYLRPEAQAKVVGIFHFALKKGGVLMLGASETVGQGDGRFAVVSKPARLYRQIGRTRPGDLDFAPAAAARRSRPGPAPPAASRPSLAELVRRLVLEAHAPAAILINKARECLYSLGPTDRYLRMAPGAPSFDVLAMARHGVRAILSSTISQAFERDAPVSVDCGPLRWDGAVHAWRMEARPVRVGGETMLLVSFIDAPASQRRHGVPAADDPSRVAELEAELAATKVELESAVRSLEISAEEQTTINEEALSVNEEYQSTNEELLTSKEEMQSLNEELNALNSQLQETLDRQRTTATDLQNILYSTDVATVFLDRDLRIRFFTPATRALFNVIPGDVGRPLADLRALAPDGELLSDARTMLTTLAPSAREIETPQGAWYARRIMPYRAQGDAVEGVVITYSDITERVRTARQLETATLKADRANQAKSRFLAAASHDLRQPLQTLTLIQDMLERGARDEKERRLIDMQTQCVAAMSGMLDTLLDINQIDAGVIKPEKMDFPIDGLLERLRDEYAYLARTKGLRLRFARCGLTINSDPALLEQMLRNLIANALKYTERGRILMGARRCGDRLRIQILDTGIGIHPAELSSIFEEYHQVENVARERSRGLGLGLSIVRRLASLLGHEVSVQSRLGRGSVFTIDVGLARNGTRDPATSSPPATAAAHGPHAGSVILVVEDDPEVRGLLEMALEDEGHRALLAADGPSAVELVERVAILPDLILVDYNLPGGMTGVDLADRLRAGRLQDRPVVVLTGDISSDTLQAIAERRYLSLHKPVGIEVLSRTIASLLPHAGAGTPEPPRGALGAPAPTVFIVDDDSALREALCVALGAAGLTARGYADGESFLADHHPAARACLLIDAYLPGGMSGVDLLHRLRAGGDNLPAIMITGAADVHIAVEAMKAGAADFIEKPIAGPELVASIARVLEHSADVDKRSSARAAAAGDIAKLTRRQRDILDRVLAGHPSKNIAADLGISQRTVENHRSAIMHRTGTRSLPALARLAMTATTPAA